MSNVKYDVLFKLLLVGDSGVGKTNILAQYTDKEFSPSFVTTIGIDFKIKTINFRGKIVKLQIWDTAGTERFRTITKSYYRGSHAVILVYDVTCHRSFENLTGWLTEINHCIDIGSNIQMILVGNKVDLTDGPDVTETSERQISTSDGKSFALENNMNFIECSAQKDENIEKLFSHITTELMEKKFPDIITREIKEPAKKKILIQREVDNFMNKPNSCC